MIAVALSGGVDSALSAALIKDSGHEVVGLFMDLGPSHRAARASAERVAAHLDVDLKFIDLAETMDRRVIEPFLDGYASGQTPNPCAFCNRRVKFRELLAVAAELGAEALATGHYARLEYDSTPPALYRGLEPAKEQSYFLARLKPDWLTRIRFPLGRLTKAQVREMAARRGLPSAANPDSQEVCFLAGRDYRDFFLSRRQGEPGDIVHVDGRVLGRHQGLYGHTVGQRRGLGLAWPEPLYVVGLDSRNNRLIVGPKEALYRLEAQVVEASWLIDPAELPQELNVQVRYRARPARAKVEFLTEDRLRVVFERPQRAVAPGQMAAFYSGERLLGGGWWR